VTAGWRFRNRKDASVGDRVFLLLQGKRGPAIVGFGKLTSEEGRTRRGTWRGIEFESLVDPDKEVLASKDELRAIKGIASWLRTQFSGVCLPKQIALQLSDLVLGRRPRRLGIRNMTRINTLGGVLEAAEGAVKLRKHFARERNRQFVVCKRNEAIRKYGKLFCEVCDLDFESSYGLLASAVIECHHTKWLSNLPRGYKTHRRFSSYWR
jgi:hypothetical protein